MKHLRRTLLITLFSTLLTRVGCAQTKEVTTRISSVSVRSTINETTDIIDRQTGQRVSFAEYRQRIQDDPYGYHLEPIYNEFGKAEAYTLRPTTPDERSTHRFYDVDTTLRPQAGKPMPLFVMSGLDGTTYRSTDLKGKPVIIGFWIEFRRPFFNEKQMNALTETLKPYQDSAGLVALGVLTSKAEAVSEFTKTTTLPFVPIPEGYGFQRKFQIVRTPSFLIIDKAGKVIAYVDEVNPDRLKAALDKAVR